MRRLVTAAMIAVIAGATLTACGSDSGSGEKAKITGNPEEQLAKYLKPPTELSVTTQLSQRPPTGKKVRYLSNGLPVGQLKEQGIREGSQALGWEYETISFDQKNPASLNSALVSAVNGGADVVFIAAVDAKQIEDGLKLAQEKGVVVIDDASGNPKTPGITARLENTVAGKEWGRILGLGILADIKKQGKAGNVVQITTPLFATVLDPTVNEVKRTVKEFCSNCTVDTLNISGNDLFAQKTPQNIVSYLQKNPKINNISFALSAAEPGVVPALKAAGLHDKVRIFGKGPLPSHLQELKAGDTHGWIAVPYVLSGWMSVDAAARALVGDPTDVYEKVGTPPWFVTPDSDFDPGVTIEVPGDYSDRFKAMWRLA